MGGDTLCVGICKRKEVPLRPRHFFVFVIAFDKSLIVGRCALAEGLSLIGPRLPKTWLLPPSRKGPCSLPRPSRGVPSPQQFSSEPRPRVNPTRARHGNMKVPPLPPRLRWKNHWHLRFAGSTFSLTSPPSTVSLRSEPSFLFPSVARAALETVCYKPPRLSCSERYGESKPRNGATDLCVSEP